MIQFMDKTYIDKLAWLYIKDGKLLVTLNRGKDTWYIPGGKRQGSETDQEALTREVMEELKVPLKLNTIKYYGTFEAQAHGKPEGTIIRMTCYQAEYEGELTPDSEVEKLDFFTYAQRGQASVVDNLIFDELHARGLVQ